METLCLRALSAALLLMLVPTAASAQSAPSGHYPATATGLAIPVAVPATLGRDVAPRGRQVLVDAASATLFMIEDGEVRDSMRVIVGKPGSDTPTIRSTLYYATLNPYWNVPTDLARTIIAPKVLKEGPAYLRERGYEVVSAFDGSADVLPAESVDWRAVVAGRAIVHVRQLPGPANSMGTVKFGFANDRGIFLHDTPMKDLFADPGRRLSNGCIRLEDAARFARWLLGREPQAASAAPEQHVPLPMPVSIVVTYLDGQAPMHLAAR